MHASSFVEQTPLAKCEASAARMGCHPAAESLHMAGASAAKHLSSILAAHHHVLIVSDGAEEGKEA